MTAAAPPRIPARHPDAPRRVPPGIWMVSRLLRLPEPTAAEFARFGELLTVGDPQMDDLVDWIYRDDTDSRKAQFHRALNKGIAAVPDAPAELREFFEEMEAVPEWVDWDAILLGGRLMRSGGADGFAVARDVALMGGYLFSGFNQTLLRTGALEKGSNKRFAETSQWALDVIVPEGLRPGGVGYRSTLHVRFIHSMVRRHVTALPDWDAEAHGLPINQTDMAATLVGALIAPVATGMGLGMIANPREYEAAAHLTRYVGRLMGVTDDFLPHSYRDSLRILFQTSRALSTPDQTSRALAQPMAEDPMRWKYPNLSGLRRRIARSQHLSIATAYLGTAAMKELGVPSTLPWYPALRIPYHLVESVVNQLPGGRERAARRGDRSQAAFMRMLNEEAAIGHSAQHVTA
ncbi:oxygenase MpaB family protein [Tsukamurella sp. 1534]|uniref:oxygenase MpaB family protein n=1 Tax=Tsukamurella sp. 1534 TaxID=1151061 RepID=UPI0002E179D4|nr:oxygenase MpaB family protein [Tsukamurella sp. 1534]